MSEENIFTHERLSAIYEQHVPTQAEKYKDLQLKQGHWGKRLEILLSHVETFAGTSVLDMGCGVGTLALETAKHGATSFGLDFTYGMTMQGMEFAKENQIQKCYFINGDVAQVPFKDSSFDLIFASDIIEHLPEGILEKMLKECLRVLKKDGKFILHTFPSKYDYFFERKEFMIFVLPLFWLPCSMLKRYLKFLHHAIIPALRKILWKLKLVKTSHGDIIHCNCQDQKELETLVLATGFGIKTSFTTTIYYGGDYGKPMYSKKNFTRKLVELLFRNSPLMHRNIFLFCEKPS